MESKARQALCSRHLTRVQTDSLPLPASMRVVFILFLSLDCNPGQALGVLLPFYVCVCVLIMCTSTECSSHRCTPFTLLGLNIILLRAAATCEGESTGLARTIYVLYLYNIYTVHIRFFWQGNYQTYGHIQCVYTALAIPRYLCSAMFMWSLCFLFKFTPTDCASMFQMYKVTSLHRGFKCRPICVKDR